MKNKIINAIIKTNVLNNNLNSICFKLKEQKYFYVSSENTKFLHRVFLEREYWEINKELKIILPEEIEFYGSTMVNNYNTDFSIININNGSLSEKIIEASKVKNIKINDELNTDYNDFEIIKLGDTNIYIKSSDIFKSFDFLEDL